MDNQPKPSLFWLLGTDDTDRWHQRIIRAQDMRHADAWWRAQLDRDAEIAISQETLEGGVGMLVEIEERLEAFSAGHMFGVWVENKEGVSLVPVSAPSSKKAGKQVAKLNPNAKVLAVVEASPLLDALARMRAIAAGQMAPDEDLC